jgi:hypothetical protein
MPFLLRSIRVYFARYLLVVFLVGSAAVLVIANVFFYFRLSGVQSRGVALTGTVVGAAFFWAGLGIVTYALVLLVATASEYTGFKALLRRALMAMALAPGLWAVAVITCIVFTGLALFSRVGIVFIAPWFATVAATTYRIVEQHADYLAEAREALGPDQPLRAYRKKALELAWDWELRQPRRTLRELIKPWEY